MDSFVYWIVVYFLICFGEQEFKMSTKTYSTLIQKVYTTLGNGNVICHTPNENNKMGQSGVHTFIDDIIDIVLNSKNEADAYKNLRKYLMEGWF